MNKIPRRVKKVNRIDNNLRQRKKNNMFQWGYSNIIIIFFFISVCCWLLLWIKLTIQLILIERGKREMNQTCFNQVFFRIFCIFCIEWYLLKQFYSLRKFLRWWWSSCKTKNNEFKTWIDWIVISLFTQFIIDQK